MLRGVRPLILFAALQQPFIPAAECRSESIVRAVFPISENIPQLISQATDNSVHFFYVFFFYIIGTV